MEGEKGETGGGRERRGKMKEGDEGGRARKRRSEGKWMKGEKGVERERWWKEG
jgi:hypothetical protein